jgi:hypothetical protein
MGFSKPGRMAPWCCEAARNNQVGATLSRYRSATIESETTQENSVVAVTGRLGVRLPEFCRTRAFWLEAVPR